LHVTGQRDDGYHEIDTLVGFAETGDQLTFELAAAGQFPLTLRGSFADDLARQGGDNTVIKAAEALAQAAAQAGLPVTGAAIVLEKHLPVASGLGGGSADAAATLLGLRELWGLPEDFVLDEIAMRLGADVAMCLVSTPLRAAGIGENLQLLADASSLNAVLVNPGVALSTVDVFAALKNKASPPIGAWPASRGDDPFEPTQLATLRNDLEVPARTLQPVIGEVLDLIAAQRGCLLARMSGSGATCFGIFSDPQVAQEAHRRIVDTKPHWWSVPTVIGGSQAEPIRQGK